MEKFVLGPVGFIFFFVLPLTIAVQDGELMGKLAPFLIVFVTVMVVVIVVSHLWYLRTSRNIKQAGRDVSCFAWLPVRLSILHPADEQGSAYWERTWKFVWFQPVTRISNIWGRAFYVLREQAEE
jgi:hypothetical protein